MYEVTGPELLSFRDAAALAAEIGGRPVEYVVVSHEEKQATFDAAGIPRRYVEGVLHEHSGPWASDEMMSYERALGEGYFAVCSRHVELITGTPGAVVTRRLYRQSRRSDEVLRGTPSMIASPPRQLLIGGRWSPAASGHVLDVFDPATGEVFAQAAAGGADDIDAAVRAARNAFERGPWRTTPPAERARLLWKLSDAIEANAAEAGAVGDAR